MSVQSDLDGIVFVELLAEPRICARLAEATSVIWGSNGCDVVVDFGSVNLVKSESFSELMRLRRNVVNRGGRLVLCNLSGFTRGIFTVVCLEELFEFAADRNAAVELLREDDA